MSIVICSNQDSDGAAQGNIQSINDAFSFRNELSSTMTIPAHSQVALQSVKVNVDGRIVLGKDNSRFYTWFGDIDEPEMEDVTSAPVRIDLIEDGDQQIKELTKSDFASLVQEKVRKNTFHPNQKFNFLCATLLDGDKKFKGYKFTFDQDNSSSSIDTDVTPNFDNFGFPGVVTNASQFTYNSSTLTRVAGAISPMAAIFKKYPMSLAAGSKFTVNISGGGNANASGVPWTIGLSRYSSRVDETGAVIGPEYYNLDERDVGGLDGSLGFCDFAVSRNDAGSLVVTNTRWDSTAGCLRDYEINYWSQANSSFNGAGRYDLSAGADYQQYTKVEFRADGEVMGIYMYHNASAQFRLLTTYNNAEAQTIFPKPINQACWCLHPVLGIGRSGTNTTSTLKIEHYSGLELIDYDPSVAYKGGWFETMELLGGSSYDLCKELEQRPWNDGETGDDDYVYISTNASGGVEYSNVLILQEDVTGSYRPTTGANATKILGFDKGIVDTPISEVGSEQIFESTVVPDISTTQAMFVRLNNFGSKVMNARTGNRSNIIAHLPRFDNTLSTGRLHFEPNNLIWIDLDNSAPLQVNEFALDFCYVNEQYARILTGQSIVVLYFRKTPKELM